MSGIFDNAPLGMGFSPNVGLSVWDTMTESARAFNVPGLSTPSFFNSTPGLVFGQASSPLIARFGGMSLGTQQRTSYWGTPEYRAVANIAEASNNLQRGWPLAYGLSGLGFMGMPMVGLLDMNNFMACIDRFFGTGDTSQARAAPPQPVGTSPQGPTQQPAGAAQPPTPQAPQSLGESGNGDKNVANKAGKKDDDEAEKGETKASGDAAKGDWQGKVKSEFDVPGVRLVTTFEEGGKKAVRLEPKNDFDSAGAEKPLAKALKDMGKPRDGVQKVVVKSSDGSMKEMSTGRWVNVAKKAKKEEGDGKAEAKDGAKAEAKAEAKDGAKPEAKPEAKDAAKAKSETPQAGAKAKKKARPRKVWVSNTREVLKVLKAAVPKASTAPDPASTPATPPPASTPAIPARGTPAPVPVAPAVAKPKSSDDVVTETLGKQVREVRDLPNVRYEKSADKHRIVVGMEDKTNPETVAFDVAFLVERANDAVKKSRTGASASKGIEIAVSCHAGQEQILEAAIRKELKGEGDKLGPIKVMIAVAEKE